MTRTPCRSLVCSCLALALGLAPTTSALAANGSAIDYGPAEGDPEELSARAVEKFEAKEYDAAVELFEKAYAADPEPNYLFNIGRVYEEKGDLENAVVYYQRFVSQSGVDLESRQTATERLKVLRETLDQLEEDKPDETPTEDITETPPEDTGEDEEAAAQQRKRNMRIAGYSVLGAGGALVIVGAVFGGAARSSANEADQDEFVDRTIALRDRARRQARTADALFITGGIVAAAGVVLVLTSLGGNRGDAEDDTTARRTTWSPLVSRTQFGVGMTHRF